MAIKTLDEFLATIPDDDNRERMVDVLVWVGWESFVPGEPLDRLNRGSLVPGGPVRLLVMSVCLRVRSACGYLLSGWEKFRMQFPLRYFKL